MIDILEQRIKQYQTKKELTLKLLETLSSYYEENRIDTCNKIIKLGNKIIDNLKEINIVSIK